MPIILLLFNYYVLAEISFLTNKDKVNSVSNRGNRCNKNIENTRTHSKPGLNKQRMS
uniref:Uncharacterized protein n=1 Tax=Anguilla anguilla TaxID=7936 RepID=A0A0E9WVU0_ANGAN